jgi:hypothetical protein
VKAVRRLRLGDRRYVDTGSGWRMQVGHASGSQQQFRLTRGEAEYVEQRYADQKRRERGAP